MGVLNFTGFEEGTDANQGNGSFDTQPFTGTAPTYDATTKRTGGYAMRINSTGSGSDGSLQLPSTFGTNGVSDTNSGSYATFYLNFYFRYATKPASSSEEIIGICDVNGDIKAVIRINSAGKLQVYDYNPSSGIYTAVGSLGATALSANTWYKIGFKLGTGASSAYEIQINDITEVSGTYTWTSTFDNMKVRVGMVNQNNQAIDYYLDDVVLKDDAFITGDYEIKVIKPTANGSTMSWTDGGSPQDYTQVDDIPRGDISTNYLQSPASGAPNVALFTMQNCSDVGITGTILSLKARIQHRENTSVSSATKIRVRSGSTNSDSDTLNGTTTGQGRIRILNTDPATGSAWTTSGIDGVEIGAVENNNVRVRLGNVMGYVLYIPTTVNNYTQNLTETITLVETRLNRAGKPFTEVIALVEVLAKQPGKAIKDALTLVDTKLNRAGKAIKEVITLSEVFARLATRFRSFTEVITLVETVSKTKVAVKSLTENITLVDTYRNVTAKIIIEVVTLAETFTKSLTALRTFTETITLVEVVTPIKSFFRTLTETIDLVEVQAKKTVKSFTETLSLNEVLSTAKTYARTFTETITLVESILVGIFFGRVLTETISLQDTAKKTTSKIFTETLTIVQRFLGLFNGKDISYHSKYEDRPGTYTNKYEDRPGTYIKKYLDF